MELNEIGWGVKGKARGWSGWGVHGPLMKI